MLVRERMKKEIKAVHMLEELLERCDPEEIDNIFLLQIVLKEEKGLLQHLAKCSNEDYQHVHDLYYGLTQRRRAEDLDKYNVLHHQEALKDGDRAPDMLYENFSKFVRHFMPEEELEHPKEAHHIHKERTKIMDELLSVK